MKGAELDRDTGTYTNKRRKSSFIECQGAFIFVDRGGGSECVGVSGGSLEADFDNVEWLAWRR
jgi:hypothetical protein